jgi:hypothetical protein
MAMREAFIKLAKKFAGPTYYDAMNPGFSLGPWIQKFMSAT